MKYNHHLRAFSIAEMSIVVVVVGLLLAMASLASKKMVGVSAMAKARSLTSTSPVIVTESLALWLETTSKNSFSNDSQPGNNTTIDTWRDINPQLNSKKDVTQTTSASKPLYVKNAINGLPALQFDGSNDYFTRNNTYGYELAREGEITIFAVTKTLSPAQQSSLLFWGTDPNRINIHAPWSDSVVYWDFAGNTSGVSRVSGTPTNFLDKWNIITTIRDSSNNTGNIYINNSLFRSGAMSTLLNTASNATLYIGCNASLAADKAYIAEIIIFNRALLDNERIAITQYLSKKWGIKIN